MLFQRQTLSLVLIFLIALLTHFGFSSVMDAVLVDGASIFLVPTLWFFITLIFFSVGTLVWSSRFSQVAACFVLLAPSLLFALTLTHLAMLFIAGLIVFSGILRIRRELMARVQLSLYRSVSVGLSQIILALSLVISSQYYTHIGTLPWDRLVPNFDLAEGSGAWMLRMAGTLSPSLTTLQNRNLSVDGFLRELRPVVEIGNTGEGLEKGIGETVRQAEVMRSKLELSRLLGREISGEESMNAILSEVLRKKIFGFVSRGASDNTVAVPFLPFFLAILLFFTVYPLGSILAPVSLSLSTLLLALLLRTGVVMTKKVSVEQELIV